MLSILKTVSQTVTVVCFVCIHVNPNIVINVLITTRTVGQEEFEDTEGLIRSRKSNKKR